MAEYTPRINATMLGNFVGKTVRILGKVTQLRGETATLDCQGSVQVHIERDSHLTVNHAIEIVGKVNSDHSIKEFASTDFGTSLDMAVAEAVVQATHRHRSIFYDDTK